MRSRLSCVCGRWRPRPQGGSAGNIISSERKKSVSGCRTCLGGSHFEFSAGDASLNSESWGSEGSLDVKGSGASLKKFWDFEKAECKRWAEVLASWLPAGF